MTPYYVDDRVTLHHADCLDLLPTLPDSSVDAVVTDPPYNLSDSGKRDHDCLSRILAEVEFPDTDERDLLSGEGVHLTSPRSEVASLRGTHGSVNVDPRIGVPEGPVHFQGAAVIQEEIEHCDEPALMTANADLPLVSDPHGVEDLGDFVLQTARSSDAPFCDGTCSCFTEPSAGVLAVPVRAVRSSSLPGAGIVLGRQWRGDPHIWVDDDAIGQSQGAPSVVTGAGAVDALVLRLDVGRRSGEVVSAHGAFALHDAPFLRHSKLVGADAGAGGLTAMLEPYRIRVVGDGADRTLTLYLPIRLRHAAKSTRTGGFMGKTWDGWESPASFQRWCKAWAAECLRVLKPGGFLLAFGGTRTSHRLTCAIEDVGFEIRDGIADFTGGGDATESSPQTLAWVYGSGFP